MSDDLILYDCFKVTEVSVPMEDGYPLFSHRDFKFFDGDLGVYLEMDRMDATGYNELRNIPRFGDHYDISIKGNGKGTPFILMSISVESDWDEMATLVFSPLVSVDKEPTLVGDRRLIFPLGKFNADEIGELFIVGEMYYFDITKHKGHVVDIPNKKDPLAELFGGK